MEEREKEQKKQRTKAIREEQDAQKPQTVQVAQDVFKGKPVEGEDRVLKVGMQAFGEDWELQNIWSKMECGDKLTKVDLVAVALLPLMSGDTSIYDRCSQGFQILKKAQENVEKEEIKKLQAMLYTLACKFLTEEDLIKLKEVIDMTVLGQALVNDATEKGIIALINAGRHFKASKEETTAIVKVEYSLSPKRAEDYVTQYWDE